MVKYFHKKFYRIDILVYNLFKTFSFIPTISYEWYNYEKCIYFTWLTFEICLKFNK